MEDLQKIYFTTLHKKNIISEATTTKQNIEPGSVIRFKYGGKQVTDKQPLVLVLNPKWKGKLHGINVNYLSETDLNKLVKLVKQTLAQKAAQFLGFGKRMTKADIGDPFKFYHTRLKMFLGSQSVSMYRTYDINAITNVRLVDYRFKGMADEVQQQLEDEGK